MFKEIIELGRRLESEERLPPGFLLLQRVDQVGSAPLV